MEYGKIEVITDHIQNIRQRPGMYVGDTGTSEGLNNLVWEVLANSVDDYLAGNTSRIDVPIHGDGSISVRDDGAGISIDSGEYDIPWIELVLTRLHDTPTADGHAPHVHLRRYHVGLCVVSALSSSLTAEVCREGTRWRIGIERGEVTTPLVALGPTEETGTYIRFTPDKTIFGDLEFDVGDLHRRVRELALLLPNLRIGFSCEPRIYEGEESLVKLVPTIGSTFLQKDTLVIGEATEGVTSARVAFAWNTRSSSIVKAYCNLDFALEGSHIKGFQPGLAKALGRRDDEVVFNALAPGLRAAISVMVVDPEFHGPTRENLRSDVARRVVCAATAEALSEALARPIAPSRLTQEETLGAFLQARLQGKSGAST